MVSTAQPALLRTGRSDGIWAEHNCVPSTVFATGKFRYACDPKFDEMRKAMWASTFAIGSKDMRDLFNMYDTDNSGSLEKREFKSAIRRSRTTPDELSDADIEQLFDAIDINGNGLLSAEEFTSFMENKGLEGVFASNATPAAVDELMHPRRTFTVERGRFVKWSKTSNKWLEPGTASQWDQQGRKLTAAQLAREFGLEREAVMEGTIVPYEQFTRHRWQMSPDDRGFGKDDDYAKGHFFHKTERPKPTLNIRSHLGKCELRDFGLSIDDNGVVMACEGPAAEAEIPDWGRIVGVGGVAVQDKEGIVAQLRALTSEKQRIEGQATGWLHQGARLTSVQFEVDCTRMGKTHAGKTPRQVAALLRRDNRHQPSVQDERLKELLSPALSCYQSAQGRATAGAEEEQPVVLKPAAHNRVFRSEVEAGRVLTPQMALAPGDEKDKRQRGIGVVCDKDEKGETRTNWLGKARTIEYEGQTVTFVPSSPWRKRQDGEERPITPRHEVRCHDTRKRVAAA